MTTPSDTRLKGTDLAFLRRLLGQQPAPSAPRRSAVDPALPDREWFGASERVYKETIEPYYGSPETMARGGDEAATAGDSGVALLFYRKSIDMLHTAYGFSQMQTRRPSQEDGPILRAFCESLEASLRDHPQAPVAETVREVTHRLRSITGECERHGIDASLYRTTLQRIAGAAPGVDVSDVLWS